MTIKTSLVRFVVSAAMMALGCSIEAADDEFDPATQKGTLLKVESGFALWHVRELVAGTERLRAPGYTHRFFRQRLDNATGRLIYTYRDTAVPFRAALRSDGSLILETRGTLQIVTDSEAPKPIDLDWLDCLVAFPDGLLVRDWSVKEPRQHYPVFFVPVSGRELENEKRVQIVEAGIKSFTHDEGLGHPGEPCRNGNEFVWIANSALHKFDLLSRKTSVVKLAGNCDRVFAYDGSTVTSGVFAFDAATGNVLGELAYQKRPRNVYSVFTVRNRIGYYFELGELRATDLAAASGTSVRLLKAQPFLSHQDKNELRIWDGQKWHAIPWLKTMPNANATAN